MSDADEAPAPVPAARLLVMLLFSPKKAFSRLRDEPLKKAVAWYGVLLLAGLFLTGVARLFRYDTLIAAFPRGYHPPVLVSLGEALIPLLLLFTFGMLVFACVFHVLVYASGGRGGIARTLAALLYAATPLLLTLWITEAASVYNLYQPGLLLPVMALWAIVLAVAGIREFHGISAARAVLPFFLLLVLIIAALALFLVLAAYNNPCGHMCGYTTAVTAACTGENITVTFMGGQDAESVVRITAYDTDPADARTMEGTGGALPIGSALVLAGPFFSPAHVIVFADYTDGSRQVILDKNMDCGSGPGRTPAPDTPAATTTAPVTKPVPVTSPASPAMATLPPAAPSSPAPFNSTKGLLVWYDFEDDFPATGTVTDRSGNGRDATVTGTVRSGPGIMGTQGITFTGNGYLLAPDNPAWGRTNVTFSFWFRTADPSRNYKFASAAEWHGGPGTGWTMATHRPEFWADDGPEDLIVPAQPNADNFFVFGQWTHEAVVYDGATMKEYTNGTLINSWQGRGVPMSRGVPMAVGGWPQFSGYNYAGDMDDFRIYERTLSAQEVAALFTAGRG